MKKKIVAVCATVALAAVAFGGATLAYFTDHDKVENNFAIGDISIDLWETAGVKDADGNVLQGTVDEESGELIPTAATGLDVKDQGGFDYTNLMPSYQIVKKPVIENTSTTNDAYVRVAVVMNNVGAINDAIDGVYEEKDYTPEQIQEVYDNVFAGWGVNYAKRTDDSRRMWMDTRLNPVLCNVDTYAQLADETWEYYGMYDIYNEFQSAAEIWRNQATGDGFIYGPDELSYYSNCVGNDQRVYVFYLKLPKGAEYTLFDGLNIPADFTAAQMEMFKGLEINVYADAIQAAGFNDTVDPVTGDIESAARKAFNALEEAHPLGWWN